MHFDLPIYQAVIDLQKFVAERVIHLPRDVKGIYGVLLAQEALEMAVIVRHANIAVGRRKALHLEQLLDAVERVQVVLRVLRDLRHLSNSVWSASVQLTVSIGKQATALRNKFAPSPSPAA